MGGGDGKSLPVLPLINPGVHPNHFGEECGVTLRGIMMHGPLVTVDQLANQASREVAERVERVDQQESLASQEEEERVARVVLGITVVKVASQTVARVANQTVAQVTVAMSGIRLDGRPLCIVLKV